MEKLSVEEKAKAYDKALEKAKALYQAAEPMSGCNVLIETLFPELKESEDEKIRKFLIKWIQDNYYHGTTEIPTKTLIAWLEKQATPQMVEDAFLKGCNDTKKSLLKRQGEQKSADKVVPKFKVGDWIIYSNEEVHLITGFDDNGYFVDKECYIPFNCEGNMRLWTIQDAKDGDVLTNGDCPCIFKSINEENAMFVYCGINGGGDFATKSESKNNIWDDEPENYYPANKEQRDTLFAKMREAGYEWDVEKKELKEVEQKQVEYIRKDAFIKKACLWLKDNTDRYLYNTGGIDEYIPKCGNKMIEDFKKYMEDLL